MNKSHNQSVKPTGGNHCARIAIVNYRPSGCCLPWLTLGVRRFLALRPNQ